MASNLHYWIDVITLPSQTKSISNLLGYQHLILEAHMYLGEVWYVYDHHLSHIAYTCLPNFLYLLAFGHRRVVTNKMYPWQAGNADPTASTALTSSIHQQCSGLPEPPCFIQKENSTYAWLHKPNDFLWMKLLTVFLFFPGFEFIHACLICYNNPFNTLSEDCNNQFINFQTKPIHRMPICSKEPWSL